MTRLSFASPSWLLLACLRQLAWFFCWSQVMIHAMVCLSVSIPKEGWVGLGWLVGYQNKCPASGIEPGARHLFRYITNQPPKANSAFHPFGVGKWVPASARKAKAGMLHSVSGWMPGVQVKLRFLENACHTWAPQRCVHDKALYKSTFTYLTLPYHHFQVLVTEISSRPNVHIICETTFTCNMWDYVYM